MGQANHAFLALGLSLPCGLALHGRRTLRLVHAHRYRTGESTTSPAALKQGVDWAVLAVLVDEVVGQQCCVA